MASLSYILLISIAVSVALAAPAEEEVNNRIINGKNAGMIEHSFMASIQKKRRNESESSLTSLCGGSIISPTTILTAANCFYMLNLDEYEIYVIVGTTNIKKSTGQKCAVDKIVEHPLFYSSFQDGGRYLLSHDIAVVKLANPLTFSQEIQPIKLPAEDHIPETTAGGKGIILGWGSTLSDRKNPSADLHYGVKYIPKQRSCSDSHRIVVSQTQFCAGYTDEIVPCDVDNGGPFIQKVGNETQVVGVSSITNVTFGKTCEEIPSVFSRVNKYLKFINKHL